MQATKPYSTIPMSEVIETISRIGNKVSVLVQGEMGIGKSSILKELAKMYPNHIPCYVDLSTKDVGDLLLPKIKTIDGVDVCEFIPNIEWGLHLNKPLLIMCDEIGKASKGVLNSCLRLLLEHKLGMWTLPEGSIVFATTNLAVEGVGDNIPPHVRNRICTVKIRKPTPAEWRFGYAENHGVHPVIIAAAIEYPEMLGSFEHYDRPDQNTYIFDPRCPRAAFVTPRSLEKASDILKACSTMAEDTLIHLLIGTVGERAALDIMNIMRLDQSMPAWGAIIADPENAMAPTSGAALCLVISKGLGNVSRETFDNWMTYLNRLPREAQALFAKGVMSPNCPKRSIATTNKQFSSWCVSMGWLF